MPLNIEQRDETCSASTTIVGTFSPAPTDDNLLNAFIWTRATGITNATGYATDVEVIVEATSDRSRLCSKIASGEGTSVSFTLSAGDQSGLEIVEVSGNATTDVLDQVASTQESSATSKSSGTTPAQSQNDVFAYAGWGIRDSVTAVSVDNGYTKRMDVACGSPNAYTITADLIISDGAAQEVTASWTTSRVSLGMIATYKEAAAAPAGDLFMMSRVG